MCIEIGPHTQRFMDSIKDLECMRRRRSDDTQRYAQADTSWMRGRPEAHCQILIWPEGARRDLCFRRNVSLNLKSVEIKVGIGRTPKSR